MPMRLHGGSGIWEMFVPDLSAGATYKYEIVGPNGDVLPLKADPCAAAAEKPPATASVVVDERFQWSDQQWMANRPTTVSPDAPISVYEVHAYSWLLASDGQDGWASLADRLVPYIVGMGFTHIELMPIMEHPFGGSWGYQPLGQFAPSARIGTPDAFARLVDRCHEAGIGVILDWVPAHFPTDAHGLARFDGTPLYEHADPREGFHQDWNTYIFNLGRNEVRGFLIGSALHWLEHYHVRRHARGCRGVHAVPRLQPQGRRVGAEHYGGRENLESVSFLQELSVVMAERCPGAVLIAEESTSWPGVTRPASEGGLGFDYKWNMGWMHDTLHYMEEEPINRRWHHEQLTFGLVYAFSEKFVLPLSHDEVVYGKGSLLGKMPGDEWQKFANLRAYYGFMWTHPGKKLLFMGGEIAQVREWNHDSRSTGSCSTIPVMPACSTWCATSTRCTGGARAAPHDCDAERLPLGGDGRPRAKRVRVSASRRAGRRPRAGGVQLHAGAAHRLPHRRPVRRRVARSVQHGRGGVWRIGRRQLRR